MDQSCLNDVAEKLSVFYEVVDNLSDGRKTFEARLTLTNGSERHLGSSGGWAIYFCHVRMIEPDVLPDKDFVLNTEAQVKFSHINGCLFKLEPATYFRTLKKGSSLKISFKGQYYSISRTDMFPNWYMTADGCEPVLIRCTVDESLGFVGDFDTALKWKRFDYPMGSGKRFDWHNPFSPEERYEKNARVTTNQSKLIIPTPYSLKWSADRSLVISPENWVICCDSALHREAKFLSDELSLSIQDSPPGSERWFVRLSVCPPANISDNLGSDHGLCTEEAYELAVDCHSETVDVRGAGPAGVFYGVQSLLRVISPEGRLPQLQVADAPRFPYRGMHIDVSRNFHSVTEMKRLLEAMGRYKMNKLQLHLTDDEGWRIEIPGLDELTQVGGRQGHDLDEECCLLPVLGSGPSIQTRFYTTEQYRELLQFARDRHIEVIPEIDMPGHAHAAIRSMQHRYDKMISKGGNCKDYRLVGEIEGEKHHSVQKYNNNAIDPGLESTFAFIDKVVTELVIMHKDIAPLKTFHLGGDEVPVKSWKDYRACQELVTSGKAKDEKDIMSYFVKRVAKLAASHGLNLGVWQDGVLFDGDTILSREEFPNREVFAYAWLNRWEAELTDCGNTLANSGFKVVMAQGTHLYFDHPYEPDPEERGLYWAARHIDTAKVFRFRPLNLLANCDEKLSGEPITEADLNSARENYEKLCNPENVIGMQGQLWSELVRRPENLHELVFPRLLSLAERSWHKASWEDSTGTEVSDQALLDDWSAFATALGSRELLTLDKMGIHYYIPPPGARLEDGGRLYTNTGFPGLTVEISTDGGATWTEAGNDAQMHEASALLRTRSADKKRTSRHVCLKSSSDTVNCA